jgi:hypothetical protein
MYVKAWFGERRPIRADLLNQEIGQIQRRQDGQDLRQLLGARASSPVPCRAAILC